MTNTCICGSNKAFRLCCGRFLSGSAIPATPKQLMRSRYAAYALGGYGDYLLSTWFPPTAKGLTAEALSARQQEWIKLEILDSRQSGDDGTVEFNAWFRNAEGNVETMHERSVFRRVQGRWFYVGGEVDTGLNR